MQKLAELCVRRPVFASVLVLIFVVVGLVGLQRLSVDRFPKVEFPFVNVRTISPGSAPAQVETEITDKIEEAVNTISGIEELQSYSSEGVSTVAITFSLEKDADVAAQEVRDKVNLAMPNLPQDIDPPTVERIDADASPVLSLSLSANRPVVEVTEYADKTLRRQIEGINGVGRVSVLGGRRRQINLWLDAYKMRAYNVTVTDVTRALSAQNVEIPGGRVDQGDRTLTLRTLGRLQSVKDFDDIILRSTEGGAVQLSDVARVEDGTEEELTSAEINGKPTVLLSVVKQSGTNALAVVDAVKERIEDIKATLPSGYKLNVVRDQSDYIEAAVHTVQEHLILGSILASFVVLLFLWNWRTTLISAIAIPTSIIATFALMYYMGFTLNVITMLALTLSVGIVIDDAIVVLENIYRFIEEKGMTPFEAAIQGTKEIGLAVLATTLSLVAVFLPVAFMSGIVGRFMNSFGLTMAFAILVSLLVSFTLTPMLSARWLKKREDEGAPSGRDGHPNIHTVQHDGGHAASKERGFFALIDRVYTGLLKWSMAHRWVIVLACFGAIFSVVPLIKAVPKNFLPQDDESQFEITARAAEGTSLHATRAIARRIAGEVEKFPDVEYTLVSIGADQSATQNNASVYVRMKSLDTRKTTQNELMQKVREGVLPKFAAENLRTIIGPVNAFGGGGTQSATIQYVLAGPDLAKLEKASQQVLSQFKKIPGVVDADSSLISGKPELNVSFDRALASQLGVQPGEVAGALRYLVGGDKVTDFNEHGEQYEVHVRAEQAFRSNIEGIGLLTVPSNKLDAVDLAQVVKFERSSGPSTIQRRNRQRQVTFTANVLPGTSEADVTASLARIINGLNLGADYTSGPLGRSKEQARSGKAFMLAFMLSLVFMYLILAAQFESWLHPITILLSLPLTVPFALFSILILGQSLNIFSMLGILVLFGVVKKNSILQIDHTNQLRAAGMNRYDAIIQANRDRLRPILMTTVAFVAGMLPLVLSSGIGSGTNRAIGSVIFGGQTLSLLLTLLATPVVYSLFDDLANLHLITRVRQALGIGTRRSPAVINE